MNIRTNLRRLAVSTVAASALLASVHAPAFAADDANLTVSGGVFEITAAPTVADFSAVTLNGTAQTATAALDAFEVNDARGTGAGWNVTVQGTQFKEWDAGAGAYVASGKTLPVSSLSMPAPTVAADGTTSAVPSITGGPYLIDAGGAVKIATAAVDAGMGKYDFTQGGQLTLSIPSSAYAKTYRSDVTVSLVSGP